MEVIELADKQVLKVEEEVTRHQGGHKGGQGHGLVVIFLVDVCTIWRPQLTNRHQLKWKSYVIKLQ